MAKANGKANGKAVLPSAPPEKHGYEFFGP
jgi:hypothetical protein